MKKNNIHCRCIPKDYHERIMKGIERELRKFNALLDVKPLIKVLKLSRRKFKGQK